MKAKNADPSSSCLDRNRTLQRDEHKNLKSQSGSKQSFPERFPVVSSYYFVHTFKLIVQQTSDLVDVVDEELRVLLEVAVLQDVDDALEVDGILGDLADRARRQLQAVHRQRRVQCLQSAKQTALKTITTRTS